MATIIVGLAVFVIVWWLSKQFAKADVHKLASLLKPNAQKFAPMLKGGGGVALLGLATLLGLRGRIDMAIPLGMVGLGLLGWMPFGPAGFGSRTQKSTGQVSRVRAPSIEMELDHDTGAMTGRVLAGRHAGVPLDALDPPALTSLFAEFDDESRALLAAYLDRREPGWRDHGDDGATARQVVPPSSGKMTEQEAYQILGIEQGAGTDAISRAHRALMKKLHPDQGGSTYLAARVNEAKDVLLRRHR
jgi:hypothetical protein